MGLYKLCEHKGRFRDRCEHTWWARFRHVRVSLEKWANREILSKGDAESVLDALRTAVRAGTFDERGLNPPPETSAALTFLKLAELYKERHVEAKRLALSKTFDYSVKPLVARFGDWQLASIKTADVEDFIADLRRKPVRGSKTGRTLTPASINRTIELLRHMLNWAIGREYLDRTPFRRGSETLIRKLREDNKRRRRISEDEEARLLEHAPPLLRSMLVAALDTGMRRGEMLALRFTDIDSVRGLIVLRGETTKSRKTRIVPIATARLAAVLKWLRLDAVGEEKPEDTLVFSDEIGQGVGSFRTTWVNTVLRAHGVPLKWSRQGNYKEPAPECMAEFRRINLHWHDLRHEYASRLVEKGVPLAQVRDLLGHAFITTTERYDNQKLENLQAAAARLESGKDFEPSPRPGAPVCQDFVKNDPRCPLKPRREGPSSSSAKSLSDSALEMWLGGRDSNPDNLVQSQVSYR